MIGVAAGLIGLVIVGQATVRIANAASAVTAVNRMEAIRCHRRMSPREIEAAKARGEKGGCMEPSSLKSLKTATRSLQSALNMWSGDYRGWRDLALLLNLTARHAETPRDQRAALVRNSRNAGLRSVSLNPGQPFTWTRIAQAELTLNRRSPAARKAYQMSFAAGPQVVDLMQPRVTLGLIMWPDLDQPLRRRVLAQIRGLARYNIRLLTETTLTNYQGLPQVRRALKDEPALLSEFTDLYNQRRRPGYRSPNTVPRKARSRQELQTGN